MNEAVVRAFVEHFNEDPDVWNFPLLSSPGERAKIFVARVRRDVEQARDVVDSVLRERGLAANVELFIQVIETLTDEDYDAMGRQFRGVWTIRDSE